MDEKKFLEIGAMFIEVKTVNRRLLMGRQQFEVVPVAGFTKEPKWVNEESLVSGKKVDMIFQNLKSK